MPEIPNPHIKLMQSKNIIIKVYEALTVNRDYRANFSQAYKVLYKEG